MMTQLYGKQAGRLVKFVWDVGEVTSELCLGGE